jgi:hypothetical protein
MSAGDEVGVVGASLIQGPKAPAALMKGSSTPFCQVSFLTYAFLCLWWRCCCGYLVMD